MYCVLKLIWFGHTLWSNYCNYNLKHTLTNSQWHHINTDNLKMDTTGTHTLSSVTMNPDTGTCSACLNCSCRDRDLDRGNLTKALGDPLDDSVVTNKHESLDTNFAKHGRGVMFLFYFCFVMFILQPLHASRQLLKRYDIEFADT